MILPSQLLLPETVLERVAVPSRKALFQHVGDHLGALFGLDANQIAEALAAREKIGSTGFGGGVAIPHARLPDTSRFIGLFARLAQPIDFGAVDDLPVDLVFVLVSPADAGAGHLKALAGISRRLRDAAFLTKLRGAGSRDAIFALFAEDEARNAA